MIKQEKIIHKDIEIMLVVNTTEKTFCIFNQKSKNTKGNARASFVFFKSKDADLVIRVGEAIAKASKRAKELIEADTNSK